MRTQPGPMHGHGDDTVFGRILRGEVAANRIYEDEQVIAIEDIAPQAPVHVLVIPRHRIPTTDHLSPADESLVGHMVTVAAEIARRRRIASTGYRLVINCREDGGQTVHHLHLHLLGGRALDWPPG